MNIEDIEKYKDEILACPLMAGLEDSDVVQILGKGTELRHFESDEILDSRNMYIILSGCIQIEKDASDGRRITMSSAFAGAAVNVASVFETDSQMSYLRTKGKVTVVEISESAARTAVERGGAFAMNMIRFLTDRIVFLNKKITNLAGYSAVSRLRMYLEEKSDGNTVLLHCSLSELAEYLGVGRASLYRALDSLKESGEIEHKGRKITLKKNFN